MFSFFLHSLHIRNDFSLKKVVIERFIRSRWREADGQCGQTERNVQRSFVFIILIDPGESNNNHLYNRFPRIHRDVDVSIREKSRR